MHPAVPYRVKKKCFNYLKKQKINITAYYLLFVSKQTNIVYKLRIKIVSHIFKVVKSVKKTLI